LSSEVRKLSKKKLPNFRDEIKYNHRSSKIKWCHAVFNATARIGTRIDRHVLLVHANFFIDPST
jgi:hypothetical protein